MGVPGLFGDTEFDIDCPNGHPMRKRLDYLRRSPKFRCDACGAEVTVDSSDLDRKMRDLEKQLRDMGFRA